MPGILIIAHAPLATALKLVAQHAFPEKSQALEALDVPPDMVQEDLDRQAQSLLRKVCCPDAMILTDVFGATPCNLALRVAQAFDAEVKVVAGVNVPMLWRALCYEDTSVDAMSLRAIAGATQGIMPVGNPRPQNQTLKGSSHDQGHAQHQQ